MKSVRSLKRHKYGGKLMDRTCLAQLVELENGIFVLCPTFFFHVGHELLVLAGTNHHHCVSLVRRAKSTIDIHLRAFSRLCRSLALSALSCATSVAFTPLLENLSESCSVAKEKNQFRIRVSTRHVLPTWTTWTKKLYAPRTDTIVMTMATAKMRPASTILLFVLCGGDVECVGSKTLCGFVYRNDFCEWSRVGRYKNYSVQILRNEMGENVD
jgi:hypothetical protein